MPIDVADAAVAFDRIGLDGDRLPADQVHRVVMANLSQDFAVVVEIGDLLDL